MSIRAFILRHCSIAFFPQDCKDNHDCSFWTYSFPDGLCLQTESCDVLSDNGSRDEVSGNKACDYLVCFEPGGFPKSMLNPERSNGQSLDKRVHSVTMKSKYWLVQS